MLQHDNENLKYKTSILYNKFGILLGYKCSACGKTSEDKLDLRIIRNACIRYMKYNDEAYCINILKRIKKDVYELVERIYPDGISDIDEDKRGWGWITDYDFNEDNTFEI